ncbi:hypothetical protein GPSY_4009 [Paraglaciecola psychrophila 170]|nr:hypothetical protein GPSY_4009 [Paraglaciecola psychrophila 170]
MQILVSIVTVEKLKMANKLYQMERGLEYPFTDGVCEQLCRRY